ncbi:hypothetical protein [Streptomyces sp. NPDC089919]|uniref:hypothetical protein n=1 Tax=Streptomyces sp. NPDC089919 TaxID=3155188 RepID=UPI00343F8066
MSSTSTLARSRTGPAAGVRDRGRTAARRAGLALGAFAAARGLGALALALAGRHFGKDPVAVLGTSWDAGWYTSIAAHGYGRTVVFPGGTVHSDLAFFPLYPGLMRLLCAVLPGVGPAGAGLLVSWTAAGAAAVGVYLIGERLHGPRAGLLLALLWGLLPHSVILSLGYTEPLLTALAAWSLYALLTRHWTAAALLAAAAGLSRPSGIAVGAAVTVAAAQEIWLRRGRAPGPVWAAGALAPLGWGGYVLWVGRVRGDPLHGYFAVQRAWGSRFDFGLGALRSARHLMYARAELASPMVLVIVAGSLLLAVLLLLDGAPLPLLVYAGVLLLIGLGGSGFFESKPRFLLPAFPLLLPLAAAMAKARPGVTVVVTAALAGLSYAYGTYLVLIASVPP